jgi:hypothetical protein
MRRDRGQRRDGLVVTRGGVAGVACLLVATVSSVVGVLVPAPLRAQPGSIDLISPNPDVSATQLRQALEFSQKARQHPQRLPPDEPLDGPLRTMNRVYELIRFAQSSMAMARSERKFADPIEDLQYKRVTDAWHISRRPLDESSSAYARDEFIELNIRNMTTTIALLQQVVPLLP